MQAALSIAPIDDFLLCPTPKAWIDKALNHLPLLLIDHAHCERKAALSAISLMNSYPQHTDLLFQMSQLAREELLHFEMVLQILKARQIPFKHLKGANYALALQKEVRPIEPYRLIDKLIIGAIIEARSSERFFALIPYLDETLQRFYTKLVKSETRHFLSYLEYAKQISPTPIDERIEFFLQKEQVLIEGKEAIFRFHSGV